MFGMEAAFLADTACHHACYSYNIAELLQEAVNLNKTQQSLEFLNEVLDFD